MPVSDGRPMSAPSALVRPPGALPLLTRHGADLVHHFYSPHEAERRLPAPHLPHRHGDAERLLANTPDAPRTPVLIGDHLLQVGHTPHISRSVPDVRDDDGNENWGPRSSRSVCARYNVCAAVDERSCARRVSGAHAAPTAVAEAGMMCDLGRVASGPWQGRTGTAGAAD